MTEQQHSNHEEHAAHASTGSYLAIAGILIIITVTEVGVFYVPAFQNILAPLLLAMSAGKFALVVMFYMHLKKDHRLFSFIFLLPLLLAVGVLAALLLLFGVFAGG